MVSLSLVKRINYSEKSVCSHQNRFLNAAEAANNRGESYKNGEQAVSFTALSSRQEAFLLKFTCLSIHGHS